MRGKQDLLKALSNLLVKVTNMRVHPCSIVITSKPVKERTQTDHQ